MIGFRINPIKQILGFSSNFLFHFCASLLFTAFVTSLCAFYYFLEGIFFAPQLKWTVIKVRMFCQKILICHKLMQTSWSSNVCLAQPFFIPMILIKSMFIFITVERVFLVLCAKRSCLQLKQNSNGTWSIMDHASFNVMSVRWSFTGKVILCSINELILARNPFTALFVIRSLLKKVL